MEDGASIVENPQEQRILGHDLVDEGDVGGVTDPPLHSDVLLDGHGNSMERANQFACSFEVTVQLCGASQGVLDHEFGRVVAQLVDDVGAFEERCHGLSCRQLSTSHSLSETRRCAFGDFYFPVGEPAAGLGKRHDIERRLWRQLVGREKPFVFHRLVEDLAAYFSLGLPGCE